MRHGRNDSCIECSRLQHLPTLTLMQCAGITADGIAALHARTALRRLEVISCARLDTRTCQRAACHAAANLDLGSQRARGRFSVPADPSFLAPLLPRQSLLPPLQPPTATLPSAMRRLIVQYSDVNDDQVMASLQ